MLSFEVELAWADGFTNVHSTFWAYNMFVTEIETILFIY